MTEAADVISNCDFDIFQEELYESDLEKKIEVIKKTTTVAIALGEESTKEKLVPCLTKLAPELHLFDEIRLHLLRELEKIVEFLGGWQHGFRFIDIYESFASSEEVAVRTLVVEALRMICQHRDDEAINGEIYELTDRLIKADWFTKCTAAGLFKELYERGNEETKAYVKKNVFTFCDDDNPMVRKAFASSLNELIPLFEKELILDEILPKFKNWSINEQEAIRVISVDMALALTPLLDEQQIETYIIGALQQFTADVSWKVRKEIAVKLVDIQKQLGLKNVSFCLTMLKYLTNDSEQIIREIMAATIVNMSKTLKELNPENFDELMYDQVIPLVAQLAKDANEEVKAAMAKEFNQIYHVIKADGLRNHLLPIVLLSINADADKILEDYVSNLNSIISIIGLEGLGKEVEKIMFDLLALPSSKWRARRHLIITIRIIAKYSHKDYFAKSIVPFYHKLLSDTVFSIRRVTPLILPALINKFGMNWSKQYIFHKVFYARLHASYLYRMVLFFCIDETVEPTIQQDLLILTNKPQDLFKLSYLNQRLKTQLEEKWVTDHTKKFKYDFNETIKVYADETLALMKEDNTPDVSKVQNEENYQVTILILLLKYVLNILKELSTDKVDNIKTRCANTLKKIIKLQARIESELLGVSDILDSLTEEEKNAFKEQIDLELNSKERYMEEEVPQIDRGKAFEKLPEPTPRTSLNLSEEHELLDINTHSEGVLIDEEDGADEFEDTIELSGNVGDDEGVCV